AMTSELEPVDARRRRVDQTETDPLAGADRDSPRHLAIDRHRVADAARHGHFHRIVEAAGDRRIGLQPEIAEHPDEVAIDRERGVLLDDERAVESAADLLAAVG